MVEIREMHKDEMHSLLQRVPFGHLGCARHGRPYIIPINFVLQDPFIYIYTTEGMKTEFIHENAEVCLQAEEVKSPTDWRSVIVTGRAEKVTDGADHDAASALIRDVNPTLTPALSRTKIAWWTRSNVEVIYRIHVEVMTGRKT